MRILFVGGTGIISTSCARLVLERGHDLYLLCRGRSARPVPAHAKVLRADVRDVQACRSALGDRQFDVVVQWVGFTPDHIEQDLALLRGRVGQYVFISSASAYQTPPTHLPITESTPLFNPIWKYSQNKIACEERLLKAYREEGVPITIVRPSHTYDCTYLPIHGGFTVIDRMRKGKPIVVPGDGTSLWTLTHARDFAVGLVGLLGHPGAIGHAFHITSDELITWEQIHQSLAGALGVTPKLVHVPSDVIAAHDPEWGASLLGDKSSSMIFDNSKVRRLVPEFKCVTPFRRGVEEVVSWYEEDERRRELDSTFDALTDRLVAAQSRAMP